MADLIDSEDDATPVLSEVLKRFTRAEKGTIRGPQPGRIISYDADKQRATIQPVWPLVYSNGTEERLPPIPNVPVYFPRGGGKFMKWPLKKDDDVIIIFAERSLAEWKRTGNKRITPAHIGAKFEVADAMAFAGFAPFSRPIRKGNPNALVMGEESPIGLTIEIHNGKIIIKGATAELLTLIDSTLTALIAFATATSAAAIEPTLAPAAVALNTAIGTVKGLLATIKGP